MIKAKNRSNFLILVILDEKKLILVKIENFKGLINKEPESNDKGKKLIKCVNSGHFRGKKVNFGQITPIHINAYKTSNNLPNFRKKKDITEFQSRVS